MVLHVGAVGRGTSVTTYDEPRRGDLVLVAWSVGIGIVLRVSDYGGREDPLLHLLLADGRTMWFGTHDVQFLHRSEFG